MRRNPAYGVVPVLIAAVVAGCGSSGESSPMSSPAPGAGFAFVNNRDLDSISVFRVDPATGALSGMTTVPTGACLGPRYSELNSISRLLFISCATSNTVASFSVNPSTGELTMNGSPVASGASPGYPELHPNGKFLYLSNTVSNTLSAYRIAPDGTLSEIMGSPFPTGLTPYWVRINDAGTFLYVTNRDSNNVSVYEVNATTGVLTQIGGSPFAAGQGARAIELAGR